MIENSFVKKLRQHTFSDVTNHLNHLLEIKDTELLKDYQAFGFFKRSPNFFWMFSIFMTAVLLPAEVGLLNSVFFSLTLPFQIFTVVYIICFLCLLGLSWRFVISMNNLSFSRREDLNILFIVVMTCYIVLRLIRFSIYPCDNNYWLEIIISRDCNIYRSGSLSWECGAMLLAPPVIYISIIKESRFSIVLLSFAVVAFTVGVLALLFDPLSFFILFFWIFVGIFLFVDIHLQSIKTYFLKRKLLETVVDNENNNDINQANEMRHMIANVAHDLKTPLSSFTSGVDIIDHVLQECEADYDQSVLTVEKCHEKFKNISQVLGDIRSTNSFMVMTINRCIDYTKASKGLKLVPRYETFDLMETLKLPLNCMRNIQNRIQIMLNPISATICSHIISDKQWLQENILCLLSNAVKYSSNGEVTITVSLLSECLKEDLLSPLPTTSPLKLKLVEPSPCILMKEGLRNVSIDTEDFSSSSKSSDQPRSPSYDDRQQRINSDSSIEGASNCNYIVFEIEDTGIGMTDEAMQTLFNPFKQTQRLAGGTGLGLYSLAKRVEALRGRYGVMKRRDKQQGSLFWFMIPYRPDNVISRMILKRDVSVSSTHSANNTQNIISTTMNVLNKDALKLNIPLQQPVSVSEYSPKSATSSTILSKSPFPHLNVLIADDSPAILKMTSAILKRQGYNIFTAENGAIAVKMIEDRFKQKKESFDFVLMDLQMPVMDGLEATRRIRVIEAEELFRGRQLIVGCSANSDNETTEEAYKAGVDGFMAKPFSLDSFNAYVIKLFDQPS